MSVPLELTVKFGANLPDTVKVNEVLTEELKDRLSKLLSGKYKVLEDGRCVLDPVGDFGDFKPGGMIPRDSVCVGIDFGPVQVSYCKDVN